MEGKGTNSRVGFEIDLEEGEEGEDDKRSGFDLRSV